MTPYMIIVFLLFVILGLILGALDGFRIFKEEENKNEITR